jgi:hypothetical protein
MPRACSASPKYGSLAGELGAGLHHCAVGDKAKGTMQRQLLGNEGSAS